MIDHVSDGEAELVGLRDREAIDTWLDQTLRLLLGLELDQVLFVAGRIDVVYGVTTGGGRRRLLVKVHRPPVDLTARRLVAEAQTVLAAIGFPCADPLAGPVEVDGRVVSTTSGSWRQSRASLSASVSRRPGASTSAAPGRPAT